MTTTATFLLLDAAEEGAGCALASRDYLHSIFCWGRFDGAHVYVEASPDGDEWFVLYRFDAKGTLALDLATPYLRGRIADAGKQTCVSLRLL